MTQFPAGFQGTNLPAFTGSPVSNFGTFRPQFSVPGQPLVTAGTPSFNAGGGGSTN